MEQYVRAFCHCEQHNWVHLLRLAVIAYNNSIHHCTLMTLVWVNYNYHPTMQFRPPPKDPSFRSQVQADAWISGMEETHQILWEKINESQEGQTK